MRKQFDIDLPDVDRDGIAEAQQLGGAGSLTLDGVLADAGTAGQFDIGDTYTGVHGVQVGIYSAGNLSALTFTVTGLNEYGVSTTEAITGPNNSTVETTGYWSQVTDVSASGAVGSDVEVGTVDETVTICPVNWRDRDAVTVAVSGLAGTLNYDIDECFDAVPSVVPTNWQGAQENKTANLTASLTLHATCTRLMVNSYSSGAELQFHVLCN